MVKKDSEKEAERPHYYSQFWLDVAAGRRVIGTPIGAPSESRPEEATDVDLAEAEPLEPVTAYRPGRISPEPDTDGFRETRPQTVVEPEPEPEEEFTEPEPEEFDLANDVDEMDVPNIVLDTEENLEFGEPEAVVEEEDLPEEEDEDLFEDEEEEDDDEWSYGRGKKKPKPGRQVKPPKKPKRDTRRGGY